MNILVVEDDPDFSGAMCALIESVGHRATPALDSRHVMDLVRTAQFHVVTLDIQMPERSGMDLLPQIRAADDDVAVVIVTGFASLDSAREAIEHEVVAYIEKPLSRERLAQVIDEVARRKGIDQHREHAQVVALGQRIRKLRQERGLTLQQLARRTDISQGHLSQIERAVTSVSVHVLFRVADALGLPIQDLFAEKAS